MEKRTLGLAAKKIFLTRTFKHSSITLVSTAVNAILGAIFYFLLARFLGATEFGKFSLFITSITLLTGIIDLGTDQGIIRFVPKYKSDPSTQNKLLKLSLAIKLITGSTVFLLILVFSGSLASAVFDRPELSSLVTLIGLGVLTQILFSFSTSLSQSLEKYILWGGLFVGTNLLRLLVVVGLFSISTLDAYSVSILYLTMPFIGFLISFIFFDKSFLKTRGSIAYLPELFKFNKWITAFVVVSTIGSRLEIYFSARYLSLSAIGVYSLAQQVSQILPQLTVAIGAVTTPKFASFLTKEKNMSYTLKSTLFTSVLALLSAITLVIFGQFVFTFAGEDFSGAFWPFIILLISMAIFFATSPIRDSIIYYFSRPQFFFWTGIAHAILVSILSIILIPQYFILGTSFVVLVGQIFVALASVWYFFRLSKNA